MNYINENNLNNMYQNILQDLQELNNNILIQKDETKLRLLTQQIKIINSLLNDILKLKNLLIKIKNV